MKRTDFQCVIGYVGVALDTLYECIKAEDANPTDRVFADMRKDLTALFHFLDEAKQHGFKVSLLYKWEDIKNECIQ